MTETETPAAEPAEPTVEEFGDWKLVTSGNWQVSVAPDGLMMLPRHLHPRDWEDFVRAGNVATQLGTDIIAANLERAKGDDRSIPKARAIVAEGGRPAGTVPMLVTPGPNPPPRSTIGRRRLDGTDPPHVRRRERG